MREGAVVLVSMPEAPSANWSAVTTVTLYLEHEELEIELADVRVREVGHPVDSREIMIATPRGEVVMTLDSSAAANCTALRIVGGVLQVRGPEADSVKAALERGDVVSVGELLDQLLDDQRDADVSGELHKRLGGWISCRTGF